MKTKIQQVINFLFMKNNYLIALVILLTLVIRLVSLQLLDDSGDSKYYMEHVKQLLGGLPYEFNHWSARFAIILPVSFIRFITNDVAIGAYILPIIFSVLTAFLVMKIAILMENVEAGVLAAILLVVYPEMIRESSQILPGIFSMVYMLSALYFLLLYVLKKQHIIFVMLSAIFVFLAYGTHIINLFFAPGLLLIILFNGKKPWKAVICFAGLLLVLFLAETLLYHLFTDFSLGRIDVIRGSHLSGNESLRHIAVWELFFRFVRPGPVFVVFFILSIYFAVKCVRDKNYKLMTLFLPVCTFFIIMLLALKSVVPLVPALPFNSRYMDVSIPFIILFSSFFITTIFIKYFSKEKLKMILPVLSIFVLFVMIIIFRSNIVCHPLVYISNADKLLDKTIAANIPLIYSRQDSSNYCDSKEDIDKVDFETKEEYIRINKNIDYINAFFINTGMMFKRETVIMPNGIKVLLCVSQESAADKNRNEYLAVPENPLLLTRRRPLILNEITIADYKKY